jgi:hypothetical protein
MNNLLRSVLTLIMFFCLPYCFRILLILNLTRRRYSFLAAFLMAIVFFLLSIMYATEGRLIIGVLMFLFSFIGGYPIQYLLFPEIKKLIKKE